MLIICPECETSYEVDPAELGEGGRKVRCAECGTLWRASAADSEIAPPEQEPEAAPDAEDWPDTFKDEDFAAPPVEMPAAEEAEDVAPPPPRRRRAQTKRRAIPKPRFVTILAAAGLAALAALGVWRQAVVGLVPDLAGLYAAAGLPVNLRGLEFRDVDTVETSDNGVPLLVVRGTIANVTEGAVEVPRLRLAVRGASGREIFVWTAMPSKHELEAGEALPFFAQLASPPAEGREVAVRFLGTRDTTRNRAVQ